MKIIRIKIIYVLCAFAILLSNCGTKKIETKEDAIQYLESHSFSVDNATIKGQSGERLKSGFSISFNNGNAHLAEGDFPYTITGITDGYPGAAYWRGFVIKICGSERYAFGGCLTGYLSSGYNTNGRKEDSGNSLAIKGNYLDAYFTKDEITKK